MSCLNCNRRFNYSEKGYCQRCAEEMVKNCEKKIEEKEKEKYDKIILLYEAQNKELSRQIMELITNKEKFNKQFSTDFDNVEAEKFYDIIVEIDSIKKIKDGWKVRFSEEGNKIYKQNETKDCIKIGVVGNGNKGKSFLLNKLSNFKLPSSTTIRTEGLSLKYPDLAKEKNKNIILLDSAGTETPLIMSDEELKDEKLNDDKNYQDKIEDLAKDKTLTELFLQNIIITTSDLLILVFGILTYSEQKLLNRVKKELKKSQKKSKKLFIVHNLQTFTKKEQVEKYINEQLMHSATFQLKKRNKTIINNNIDNIEQENNYFYEERERNEDNCNKDDIVTIHLIMANDLSEAGEYYNNFAITYLRDQMTSCTNLQPFDVIEDIKNKFSLNSSELLDNIVVDKTKIEVINDESDKRNINKIIRLSDNIFNLEDKKNGNEKDNLSKKQLILKKCLVDELGFSNFCGSGYEPKFRYYIQNSKLYINIEVPGIKKDETVYDVDIVGENYQFKFSGVKEIEKTPNNDEKQKCFSNIIQGPFKLLFQLKISDFPLVDKDNPEFEFEDGIMTAIFELKTEKTRNKKVVFKKK